MFCLKQSSKTIVHDAMRIKIRNLKRSWQIIIHMYFVIFLVYNFINAPTSGGFFIITNGPKFWVEFLLIIDNLFVFYNEWWWSTLVVRRLLNLLVYVVVVNKRSFLDVLKLILVKDSSLFTLFTIFTVVFVEHFVVFLSLLLYFFLFSFFFSFLFFD